MFTIDPMIIFSYSIIASVIIISSIIIILFIISSNILCNRIDYIIIMYFRNYWNLSWVL